MPLVIVEQCRKSLTEGRPLRQSDLALLLAVTDQLWRQARSSRPVVTPASKRRYMRDYMRQWRAKRRPVAAQSPSPDTNT